MLILAWLLLQGSTVNASLKGFIQPTSGIGQIAGAVQQQPVRKFQHCSTISRQVRVLVVDDDNGQRIVIKIMLSKNGYQVDTAEDGDDAVKAAQNVSYDLIFMDGCMPNKTGLEATVEIRANEAAKGLEMEDRSPFHVPLSQTISKNV
jgi:CheY-like chemotaxis protein